MLGSQFGTSWRSKLSQFYCFGAQFALQHGDFGTMRSPTAKGLLLLSAKFTDLKAVNCRHCDIFHGRDLGIFKTFLYLSNLEYNSNFKKHWLEICNKLIAINPKISRVNIDLQFYPQGQQSSLSPLPLNLMLSLLTVKVHACAIWFQLCLFLESVFLSLKLLFFLLFSCYTDVIRYGFHR